MSAEPIIKVSLMEFKNRVQKRLKKSKKKFNKKSSVLNSENNDNNNIVQSEDESNNDKNYSLTPEIKKEKVKEDENSVDPNTYLNQYVGNKSIKRIQILSIYMFIQLDTFGLNI